MFGSAPGVVTPAPPNASSGDGCALARDTVSQTPPPACRVQDAELFRGGAAGAGGAALSAARGTVSTSASPRTVPQPLAEPGRAGCAAVGRTGHSPNSPARPAPAPWQTPTAWFLCLFNGVTVRLAAGYFCVCAVAKSFSHKGAKAQRGCAAPQAFIPSATASQVSASESEGASPRAQPLGAFAPLREPNLPQPSPPILASATMRVIFVALCLCARPTTPASTRSGCRTDR